MSKFLKSLCKIAIPVTLQSMLQSSFSIVDQIMIGQLGETNISAVGLCGNFSLIFSVMIGAVSTVAGILIAQFIGAEESKEAWCSFDVSLICGIIMSVLFLLAAGVFPSQILGLYTKDMSIVNPSVYQSGNFQAKTTRMSKRGSRVLRYALVNAAWNVVRNNATFKAYYDAKRAEGRSHYNALGHCSGKLVRVIWKMLTDNVEFNLK